MKTQQCVCKVSMTLELKTQEDINAWVYASHLSGVAGDFDMQSEWENTL